MKRKRIGAAFMLALCMIFASAGSVVASTHDYLDSNKYFLTLSAYISGLEGPLLYQDKVWYTASLTGSDAQLILDPKLAGVNPENMVFIEPGTDKETLKFVYLYDACRLVSGPDDGEKCGYGGKEARLRMWVCTEQKTISTPLDK